MMTTKGLLAGIYWAISLFAFTGTPIDGQSNGFVIMYYVVAVVNLLIASLILNRQIKKENGTTTATNRN